MRAIYLDMDGTIADLYGVESWLERIRSSDVSPYEEAAPLVDMAELRIVLNLAKSEGVHIGIISWGCKGSSLNYLKETKRAKIEWIEEHLGDVVDTVKVVPYGVPKQRYALDDSILVDDSPIVCGQWDKGKALDAKMTDWLKELEKLIEEDL